MAARRTGTGWAMAGRRAAAPFGARSRDGAFRAVDLRSAARRAFRGTDRVGAERGGRALPVSIRPRDGTPPHRRGLDAGHGHHDLAESAVYGPSGVEPGSGPTATWFTRVISPWDIGRCSGGTCRTGGLSPIGRRSGAGQRRGGPLIAAQDIHAARGPSPRGDLAGPGKRRYLLAGLLTCAMCGRRMESAWANGKPAYRCRHGHTTASAPDPDQPKERLCPRGPHRAAPARPPPAAHRARQGQRRRRTRGGIDIRHQFTAGTRSLTCAGSSSPSPTTRPSAPCTQAPATPPRPSP